MFRTFNPIESLGNRATTFSDNWSEALLCYSLNRNTTSTMAYKESKFRAKPVVWTYGQSPKQVIPSPPHSPTSDARFPAFSRLPKELRDMIYEYSDMVSLQKRLWANLSSIYSEPQWERVGCRVCPKTAKICLCSRPIIPVTKGMIPNEVMDLLFAKNDFHFEPSS